jgi:hypothetical protein
MDTAATSAIGLLEPFGSDPTPANPESCRLNGDILRPLAAIETWIPAILGLGLDGVVTPGSMIRRPCTSVSVPSSSSMYWSCAIYRRVDRRRCRRSSTFAYTPRRFGGLKQFALPLRKPSVQIASPLDLFITRVPFQKVHLATANHPL